MLLTKPLTTFLNANRSPQIHTLLLVTPQGKLLSSSSPFPASTLRAQATLACQIWNLYRPLTASGAISAALPPSSTRRFQESGGRLGSESQDEEDDESEDDGPEEDPPITSIALQLTLGAMVIRLLKCSLLFITIGPSSSSSINLGASSSSLPTLSQGISYLSVATVSTTSPPTSSHSFVNGDGAVRGRQGDSSFDDVKGLGSSAPSVMGSTDGRVAGASSMKVIRRQAEELAKWLDGELEGFTLSTGL